MKISIWVENGAITSIRSDSVIDQVEINYPAGLDKDAIEKSRLQHEEMPFFMIAEPALDNPHLVIWFHPHLEQTRPWGP